MTSPENFVSRWARLKRGSVAAPKTEPAANGSHPEAVAAVGAETPSAHQRDEVIDEPFDPASLPSIETITVDTDIRGFLQSRVPAALTRAALRHAWASDPAIRDFIGIAENQWDFNDPTAMPGFGPMREADNVPTLLARALGGRDKLADMIPEVPAPVENALPAVAGHEPANPDRSLQQTPERLPLTNDICNLPDDGEESTVTQNDRVAEEDDSSRSYRAHGSALPR
jgi:Protein of unknown function (DUF3306)